MNMLHIIFNLVKPLRISCSRSATFFWMKVAIFAMCACPDGMGVSSFMRCAWLKEKCYHRLIQFFNSTSINLKSLTDTWASIVREKFTPCIIGNKYRAFVADGINIAKEGKKMPAVKKLHCASDNNSKPEFIMGHFYQVISSLCSSSSGTVAVPITSRICDGLTYSNRSKKTIIDRLIDMFRESVTNQFDGPLILIADAYYASRKVMLPLLQSGHQLISRVKSNAVAYRAPDALPKGRGRPRKYGEKIKLYSIFDDKEKFSSIHCPIYGERDVELLVHTQVLLWRSAGVWVRYVWAMHPKRGKIVLICSDTDLDVVEIIRGYGLRFKIEVSFKTAKHVICSYCYRFWMRSMEPTDRKGKNLYLPSQSKEVRAKVEQKMNAYHLFVQLGCIAQGLLQYLSLYHGKEVWASFRGWIRTIRSDVAPSEQVVSFALSSSLLDLCLYSSRNEELHKFMEEVVDPSRLPGARLAA